MVGGEETPPHNVLSDEVDGSGNEGASLKSRNGGMVVRRSPPSCDLSNGGAMAGAEALTASNCKTWGCEWVNKPSSRDLNERGASGGGRSHPSLKSQNRGDG